jgi:hypothetical protein
MEFVEFPKMARLCRDALVSEKIDGSNGVIYIEETNDSNHLSGCQCLGLYAKNDGTILRVFAGSRTRWITPNDDNFGFAKWVQSNMDTIAPALGPGRHFGEWMGSGIQRNYGLKNGERRFLMFNVLRWCLHDQEPQRIHTEDPRIEKYQERLPECIGLVPVLYRGPFDTAKFDECLELLKRDGSKAVKGFMHPEGICVFHIAGNVGFKRTIEKDEVPKSKYQYVASNVDPFPSGV